MEQIIDIFWTGGWDSTFRVLSLVESGYKVRPHYIVDPGRPSRKLELQTISKITDILNRAYGDRILDLKVSDLESIYIPNDIADSYDQIRNKYFVGSQYKWLAAYASINNIEFLELAIHKDDRAFEIISDYVVEDAKGRFILGEGAPLPLMKIFQRFSYPIVYMSKSDMKDEAHTDIAKKVMALTWFCHTPAFGGYPCGHCNPCIYTAKEGLIERLPWHAKVRFYIRIYPRLKSVLAKFPKIHNALLKLK